MPISYTQRYEIVDTATLRTHPDNARRGNLDALAESLNVNGWYGAVVVQLSTRRVLAGNHRLIAAREHGIAELPAIFVDVDDDAARRIMLADNRTNDLATYDDAALIELLRAVGDDLAGTAYTHDDLALLLAQADVAAAVAGDDEQSPSDDEFGCFDHELIVDAAFEHYRARGFPYRDVPLHEQMQQLNRLATLDDAALVYSDAGYQVADTYHPERFAVRVHQAVTMLEAWDDDERLRLAIGFAVDDGLTVNDTTLLSKLSFVRGTQAASNFRPAFALLMYRRFAPRGATVLDTSAGYGGRLLGYAASDCARYIGIDPNATTMRNNADMCKRLDIGGVDLIVKPAEDVATDEYPTCDFAFTSPPYFAKERYADDDTQSCVRYTTGEAWRDLFLAPTLDLHFDALRSGAYNVINIANVEIGSREYPLLDWTLELAEASGFELVRVERFPLSRVPGRGEQRQRFEPLVVLRKP